MVSLEQLVTVATPLSVLVLAYQLWQRKKQFTTEFEDSLTEQYRNIIFEMPVEALLDGGDDSDKDDYVGDLKQYYKYIDLTNEQVFLRQEGRVSKSTWEDWRIGIESHLSRTDFRNAWKEIQARSDSFRELRKLEREETHDDPRYWENPYRAKLESYWHMIWSLGG